MTEKENINEINSAVILTGGSSSRFGMPKGLQIINGRPLLAKLVDEVLKAGIETVYISTDYPELYEDLGLESIPDLYKNAGPMSGIYSSLVATGASHLIFLPCDLPGVTADVIRRLVDVARNSSAVVVYAATEEREHPLVSVVSSGIIPELKSALDDGKHAVYRFFHEIDSEVVRFENEKYFINMNTPEDLVRWEDVNKKPGTGTDFAWKL